MNGFRPLSVAMFKRFARDRMALFFAVIFPLVFLFFFGAIFSDSGQSRSKLLVIGSPALLQNMDPSTRDAFDQSFRTEPAESRADALDQVADGDADGAVEQNGDVIVVHFSRTDATAAAVLQATLGGFVDAANVEASGHPPRYRMEPQQVEDTSLEGIQFVAPGLLGWSVAFSATFSAALNIVTWRQSELLRRLRLTPVPVRSIISARVLVSMVIALVQVALFLVVSVVVFDMRLTGSWYMAVPIVLAGTVTFLSIGLFCGSVARTDDGASALTNLIVLPMAFLSGSFIPLSVGPEWMDTVSRVFPLRYLNEGMLDTMVRGKGPAAAVVPIVVLLSMAVVIAALATRFFRWEKQ